MDEKQERLIKRNGLIRTEFREQYKKGQRTSLIFEKLAERYYLSIDTIGRIVMKSGTYKEL